jgi:uncharacterized protein YjbI with pentapeptide repeats
VTLTLLVAAAGLSACNSGSPSSSPFVKSTDCHVSVTNLDYAGCNFTGRHFVGVDFQSDDLRRTNFSGADLDGADLQGATTAGVVTKGTITNSDTICVNATLGPCTKPGLRSAKPSQSGT